MIFTLGAELRKMRAAAHKEGRQEGRTERDKEWEAWLEAVLPDLEAGRDPIIPRPSASESEKAITKGRQDERRKWLSWYETVKEDIDNGRLPSVPPPNRANGAGETEGRPENSSE